MTDRDVIDDLEDELDALSAVLSGLSDEQWAADSACEGWSVTDVVLHLAQSEEAVVASLTGRPSPLTVSGAGTIDEVVAQWVDSERGAAAHDVLARWEAARRSAMEELRRADPASAAAWATAPLKPKTLATTRLAEHWAHALDVTGPLGIDYPDTDRLRHVARLAHRTLPYAFARAGREAPPQVRMELTGPAGDRWTYGPDDATCVVRGEAGTLCRVAAQRLRPAEAHDLEAQGERGDEVLELIRTYA